MPLPDWSRVTDSLIILAIGGAGTWFAKSALKTLKDMNHAFGRIRSLEDKVRLLENKNDRSADARWDTCLGQQDSMDESYCRCCPILSASSSGLNR